MKRINMVYGGISYSIGRRDLDDLQNEIASALKKGDPYWLMVNHGEGMPQETRLLITRGVDLALIPVAEPEQSPEFFSNEPVPPPAR
jgi:hypothetical protein